MMETIQPVAEALGWRLLHIGVRLLCLSILLWPPMPVWFDSGPAYLWMLGLFWGFLVIFCSATIWLGELVLSRWLAISRRRIRTDGWFVVAGVALIGILFLFPP